MTNKEIRALAKQKRETARGLVPMTLALWGMLVALEVVAVIGFGRAPSNTVTALSVAAVGIFAGLICGAGVARASIQAWETGVTRPAVLFSCFKSGRLFMRALAPALIAVALSLAWYLFLTSVYMPYFRSMMGFVTDSADKIGQVTIEFSPIMYAMPLAGLVIGLGSIIVGQLYYAIHLWPEMPIATVLWRGGKRAAGAIGRAIGMGFMTVIKPLLIFYGALICGLLLGVFMGRYAAIGITIALFLGAVVYLVARLMPYLFLAFAGLAIDVFREDGTKMEETK